MSTEEQLNLYLHALPQFQEITSKEQVQLEVMKGNTLIVIQNEYYLLDFRLSKNDEVNQTSIETTIHGSQLAFSDNLATNINIIRTNYHQPSLTVEYIVKGEVNQQKIAIIYDKEKVKTHVLKTVRKSFKG